MQLCLKHHPSLMFILRLMALHAWSQISILPVKFVVLGVRSAVQLSLLAFLESSISNGDLASCTLPPCFQPISPLYLAKVRSDTFKETRDNLRQPLSLTANGVGPVYKDFHLLAVHVLEATPNTQSI